jgi:hypothetical protein
MTAAIPNIDEQAAVIAYHGSNSAIYNQLAANIGCYWTLKATGSDSSAV